MAVSEYFKGQRPLYRSNIFEFKKNKLNKKRELKGINTKSRSARCCGVESPADYNNSAWLANLADRPAWQPPLLSASGRVVRPSVRQQQQEQHSKNVRPLVTDQRVSRLPLPDSCCRSASLSLDQLRASGFLTAVAADVPPGRKEVYGTGKHRQQLRDYNERYNERMMREQLHRQREQAKLLQDNVTGPILSR